MLNEIIKLNGVTTKALKLKNLFRLYIDGIAVAAIRPVDDKIQVFSFIKFGHLRCDGSYINLDEFTQVVETLREKVRP